MKRLLLLAGGALVTPFGCRTINGHPFAAPRKTSLLDRTVRYTVPEQHFVELRRGPVSAIVVDNAAVDESFLPGHHVGLNGVASLMHESRPENLFKPAAAGLDFEFIHDGTPAVTDVFFEPRRTAMELRVVDDSTVELYQPPTPSWNLESCGRYQIQTDGTIEYTFECIPHARVFKKGYIGLFWANYIQGPDDRAIYFRGRLATEEPRAERWIRAVSPEHGVESTHPPAGPLPDISFDPEFDKHLISGRSRYVYTEPWYFGVSHGMAYALMFRNRDRLWFAQSPNGGGRNVPAWDFQWFIPDYQVGVAYGFVMRVAYFPFQDREQVDRVTRLHRDALNSTD